MTYQEELIVPMLRNLFASDVDGAEGVGQILPACGIQVGGRLVKESDPGADGLQERQPQGNEGAHGLAAGKLVVAPLPYGSVLHVLQHDLVIVAPVKLFVSFRNRPVDAVGP